MDLLPEFDDGLETKQSKFTRTISAKTVKANVRLRVWLTVAIVIIILGALVVLLAYSSVASDVEAKVRLEFGEQILSLENEVKSSKSKYEEKLKTEKKSFEEKLAKEKETYEKKLADATEKYEKEIAKKDKKITDQEDKIRILEIENKISAEEIEKEVKAVGKLTTLEYQYTFASKFEDPGKLFMAITGKSFIVRWDGVVAMGVDMSKVKIVINESSKVVSVFIPKAQIFYHDPDFNSTEILDEKNSIFNAITVSDYVEFEKRSEKIILNKIEEAQYLENAYENAKIMVENMLKAFPQVAENYTISFHQI